MRKAIAVDFVIAFSCLLATATAFAADTPVEEQLIPQAPKVEVDTSEWSGLYLGVYGGYSWFSADDAISGGSEVEGEGEKLGAYAGYNWQFKNNIVTGFEALGGYSESESSSTTINIEQEWDASLRARLGYAFDQSVIYSFAGLAVTSIDAQRLTGTDDRVLDGYTVGGGWETLISDSVTARIEYGFSDYNDETFSLGNPVNNRIDFQDQSVNVGIGLRY